MRAVVQSGYGDPSDVLGVREVTPPRPADDEVLVRVRATSVHPDVWHVVTGRPRVLRLMGSGLRRPEPAIPGTDLAGVVEETGAAVTRFRPGDEVFGESVRGMQWRNGGAYAELATAPADGLAPKPPAVSFEQAATVPTAGLIALMNLRDLDGLDGRRVLVNGAGGGVGSIALQLAVAAGARVTAVDHASKLDLLRQLGAHDVVDYTAENVTERDERFDLVFDVVGSHPFPAFRRLLPSDGRYVLIGHDQFGRQGHGWFGSIPRMFGLVARSVIEPRLHASFGRFDRQRAMTLLHDRLRDGTLTPVIDRAFRLEEVADAIAYLASGRALGRLVCVP